MRKVEKRAGICLLLAAVLFLGIIIFGWRFIVHGEKWASFYGNQQIYTNGNINRGTIFDRDGNILLQCTKDGITYSDDAATRISTVHVVGDPKGNVATGAINKWKGELIGYDILNGTYDTTKDGKEIKMTIDTEASKSAYNALAGREGCVGVFNYKTGEILCLVNTPSFDPAGVLPSDPDSSVYFNTFLMGALTPGSTFKLVTSGAAIENLADIDDFSFTCDGRTEVGTETINCPVVHGGPLDFRTALAVSCNGAFGEIAREVGPDALKSYTEDVGLTETIDINGIKTAKGSFEFPDDNDLNLSWAGIGQYNDLVNPCAMMVYMGAIANNGKAVQPTLIASSNILRKIGGGKSMGKYIDTETANELKDMMKNNVVTTYGEQNFAGLDIYAKSGTAEVGTPKENAWFTGFIDNPGHPYAFTVWIKGGGTGYTAAGPVAKTVLNTLIEE